MYESNNPPKCSAKQMDEKDADDTVFSLGDSAEQDKFNLPNFVSFSPDTSFLFQFKKYSCWV